jgi:alpha-glucosidase
LPLVEDAERLCVRRQLDDADSLLSLVRRLAWRRRHDPCLQRGEQRSVNAGEGILGYLRELDGDTLLVLLNFEAQAGGLNHRDLPERATLELSTHRNREPETVTLSDLQLRPNEGLLLRPLVG